MANGGSRTQRNGNGDGHGEKALKEAPNMKPRCLRQAPVNCLRRTAGSNGHRPGPGRPTPR